MKKILAFFMTLIMVFSLTACFSTPEEDVAAYVKAYVETEDYKEMQKSSLDGGIESRVYAEGCNVVMEMKLQIDIPEEDKEIYKEAFSDFGSVVMADDMREEEPNLEKVVVKVLTNDGEVLVTSEY